MIEEKFAEGSSYLHQRDTRCKIIAATLLTGTIATLQSFQPLFAALVFAIVLILLSGIPTLLLAKRIALLNLFTLFLWITLPLTYGGETFYLGPFNLSRDGVTMAALITLKTNTIIPVIITLLCTSYVSDLGHALSKLKLPKKLCFLLLFSYRYIFVIYQEYTKLLRAAKMRCFSPRTNLHTYRTFGYLFGMTLVKSYNRSQRVYQAMLLRGFSGKLTSLNVYRSTHSDKLFLLFVLLCCAFLLFLPHIH